MEEPAKLSVDSLFDNDDLKSTPASGFQFAPDGSCITFLHPEARNASKLSIWRFDLATNQLKEWISAPTEPDENQSSTEFEQNDRERKRQFNQGIADYSWHPDGQSIIVPLGGQVFLIETEQVKNPRWKALTEPENRATAAQLSPKGSFISFVEDNNLHIKRIDESTSKSITFDTDPLIINGLPDFLAAEEMHRFQGHWWSQDEKLIAYCRVDERQVEVSHRLDIKANLSAQIPQRYPYAGQKNPVVELCQYDLQTGESKCIWTSKETDHYLARVYFSKSGLFIIEQSRSQKVLSIKKHISSTNTWTDLYVESSDYWVNLTDDLNINENGEITYTSETSGTRQAIQILQDGSIKRPKSPTHINQIIDVKDSLIFAMGWDDTPIENHLFEINLIDNTLRQLTTTPGWHQCHLDVKTDKLIDCFSNLTTPPTISLRSMAKFEESTPIQKERIEPGHPYYQYYSSHSSPTIGMIRTKDNTPLYYRVTPPKKISSNHPVITYVYGGPGAQKVKNEWTPYLLQLFAEEGFGVIELDNRGSSNRGIQFESAIYQKMGQQEVDDQKLGLKILKDFSWAAKDRVGVFGHSYGGYMSLMCLSKAPSFYKSGVAVAPVCDWRLYDTHYTERYMGQPEENEAGYLEGNVLKNLAGLDGRLLLMHGMADDNVLFTHSTMIINELQRLNKQFELMVYPGAKHSLQEKHVSKHRFRMILDFFHRTL